MKKLLVVVSLVMGIIFYPIQSVNVQNETITVAILAKDKAHCLPLYLSCLEKQTWPASQTFLYVRTNNNNDDTKEILIAWLDKVKDRYKEVYFDDTNVAEPVQDYKPHEWNCMRFKVLGEIRNKSLAWAYERGSHYFVVDCDNFILPHTLEAMVNTSLPIVAPLLCTSNSYSNYHADIDENGYYKGSPYYLPLLNREIRGLVQVPVVHCTYFIRHDLLPALHYDDNSYRYEYVIFSDVARKKRNRPVPRYT